MYAAPSYLKSSQGTYVPGNESIALSGSDPMKKVVFEREIGETQGAGTARCPPSIERLS